jgi:hypothetical protein
MYWPFYEIASYTSVLAGVATTVATLVAAYAALRRNRAETAPKGTGFDQAEIDRIRAEIAAAKPGAPIPFEIEQLASYYALTLGQARVSFWFSLIFAAIGFVVIIAGAAFSAGGELTTAVLKVGSGLIVDAISALFFVQSRRAQESMSAFFEKLRNDRQFVEARRICDDITNAALKNHLKTILVLQYSGLDASTVTTALAANVRDKSDDTKAAETHVPSTPHDTNAVGADVRAKLDDTKVAA